MNSWQLYSVYKYQMYTISEHDGLTDLLELSSRQSRKQRAQPRWPTPLASFCEGRVHVSALAQTGTIEPGARASMAMRGQTTD